MLIINDIKVDNADDIMIDHDLLIENGTFTSSLKVVERRLVARDEDFIIDDIAAGLDKFLFGNKSSYTNDDIMFAMNNALQTNSLLSPTDYNIILSNTIDKRIHLLIKFTRTMDGVDNFRIIVDPENQKIFRG
jgi:hypothetical protein